MQLDLGACSECCDPPSLLHAWVCSQLPCRQLVSCSNPSWLLEVSGLDFTTLSAPFPQVSSFQCALHTKKVLISCHGPRDPNPVAYIFPLEHTQ